MSGLFALTTPFAIFTTCLVLITPPAWRVPIAMSLTFLIRLSSKRFGLPTFLKTKLSPPVLHLFFQLFTEVSNKHKYWILYGKFFDGWRCYKCQCMISNFSFNFFDNLFLILLWSTMRFINFVYSKPKSAFVISFVAEKTAFVTVISSTFSVFLIFS